MTKDDREVQRENAMKKMRISICLCLCLAMILSILSVHTEAYAYDKTEVTLNFIDNPTFRDNEVIYNVGDGDLL